MRSYGSNHYFVRQKPFSKKWEREVRPDDELISLYYGDHSFELLWIGPYVPEDKDLSGKKMAELRRAFREANLIGELIDNWKDGLVSKPFQIAVKTKDGSDRDGSDALIFLMDWIELQNQAAIQSDPDATSFRQSDPWQEFVLALGVLGCAHLRIWERRGDLYLHCPRNESIITTYGDDTFIESIEYRSRNMAELHKMDEQGNVIISKGQEDEGETFSTDGNWFIQSAHADTLLTESVISLQAGLCHDLTMLSRNQQRAGFTRRTLMNAELPTDEYQVGPGIDEYQFGIPEQANDGSVRYTTPTVHESQPFPVENFEKSIGIWTEFLYRGFRQSHVLQSQSGNLSGESRLQMRAAMMVHLQRWKRKIESAFSNSLNLILLLSDYENFQATVNLQLSTGPMSAEELNALVTQYKEGLLSRETAIALLGSVQDPTAEIEKIERELKEQTEPDPVEPPTE